jgi:Zn finger protein HypA/HybF involved in hydrogenase expression
MAQEADFKCLRCACTFRLPYSPETEPQERACPKCKSNSVRRMKEEKPAKASK